MSASSSCSSWADFVFALRAFLGDSQTSFAARLGMNGHRAVSRWERGAATPSPMAQAFLRLVASNADGFPVSAPPEAPPSARAFGAALGAGGNP